ncbi:hypothetical protein BH23GEM9_BH23GEM9_26420 [soil metagenome]
MRSLFQFGQGPGRRWREEVLESCSRIQDYGEPQQPLQRYASRTLKQLVGREGKSRALRSFFLGPSTLQTKHFDPTRQSACDLAWRLKIKW